MGLFDFLAKRKLPFSKPLQTVLPSRGPLGSMVSIERGIVTWQGADAVGYVNDGYVGNDFGQWNVPTLWCITTDIVSSVGKTIKLEV